MKTVRIYMLVLVLFALWLLPVGCGGGGGPSTASQSGSGTNVQTITVNGGPVGIVNIAFTSVKICVPGSTTQCQTIDNVMVDTGTTGLRLLSSALSLSLPTETIGSNNLAECVQFADLSYIWGPIQIADVYLANGNEYAPDVPIHIINFNFPTTSYIPPNDCSYYDYATDNTEYSLTPTGDLSSLGANGLLGLAPFQYDCPGCEATSIPATYYTCNATTCSSAPLVSLTLQVQNPVALFSSTDNNGVIVDFPAVSGPTATQTGSLIFGINTQSNNSLGSATVLYLDLSNDGVIYTDNITDYTGTYIISFLDTGSNGYFFPNNTLTACSETDYTGWYCPTSPPFNVTATNFDIYNTTSTVSFNVDNAYNMFTAYDTYAVFPALAGPVTGPPPLYFDWGLPFFYGRKVYNAIDTKNADQPYWAY